MGYHYNAPNSLYGITMQEIQRLQRGYAALNKVEGKKDNVPRESDWKKLKLFKKKLKRN